MFDVEGYSVVEDEVYKVEVDTEGLLRLLNFWDSCAKDYKKDAEYFLSIGSKQKALEKARSYRRMLAKSRDVRSFVKIEKISS